MSEQLNQPTPEEVLSTKMGEALAAIPWELLEAAGNTKLWRGKSFSLKDGRSIYLSQSYPEGDSSALENVLQGAATSAAAQPPAAANRFATWHTNGDELRRREQTIDVGEVLDEILAHKKEQK